jgi:hypothetical protein
MNRANIRVAETMADIIRPRLQRNQHFYAKGAANLGSSLFSAIVF